MVKGFKLCYDGSCRGFCIRLSFAGNSWYRVFHTGPGFYMIPPVLVLMRLIRYLTDVFRGIPASLPV